MFEGDDDTPVSRSILRDAYWKLVEYQDSFARWTLSYFVLIQAQIVLVALKLGGVIEPRRVWRRLFRLSHAAMAGSSSMA